MIIFVPPPSVSATFLCTSVSALLIWARTRVRGKVGGNGVGRLFPFLLLLWSVAATGQHSGCLEVEAGPLRCEVDALVYSFTFVNNSSFAVNRVRLLPPEGYAGDDVLLSEETIVLPEEVPPGGSFAGALPVRFLDADGDGNFCFDVVLRRVVESLGVNLDCCYATHCVAADSTELLGGPIPGDATLTIGPPPTLLCDPATVDLTATTANLPPGVADGVEWAGPTANALLPPLTGSSVTALEAGLYVATYRDAFGCAVRDSVVVVEDRAPPIAVLPDTVVVSCDDMPQLDGSGSTPAGLRFAWSATAGGFLLSGEDTPRPFVEGEGLYRLVVTNAANGCRDTAETRLIEEAPPPALLPEDVTDCEVPQTIIANLPPGTTGGWRQVDGNLAVWSVDGAMATVTDPGDGLTLVWTLSTPDCPDYSSDTIVFSADVALIATNDTLTRFDADGLAEIDLLANDLFDGPVTLRLLNEPAFGAVTLAPDGTATVRIDPCTLDDTSVDYELVSDRCGGAVASATLFLRSNPGGAAGDRYNAITPNGDGLNDVFVFEQIEVCPDRFPNRAITIFNRWGDVLFEAAPYNNDWGGTNQRGGEIPEGTYYYVLRLDVGEGEGVRGEVTVIR